MHLIKNIVLPHCVNLIAGKRAEAVVSMNVLATRLLFSPYWNKELRLPSLSVEKVEDEDRISVQSSN